MAHFLRKLFKSAGASARPPTERMSEMVCLAEAASTGRRVRARRKTPGEPSFKGRIGSMAAPPSPPVGAASVAAPPAASIVGGFACAAFKNEARRDAMSSPAAGVGAEVSARRRRSRDREREGEISRTRSRRGRLPRRRELVRRRRLRGSEMVTLCRCLSRGCSEKMMTRTVSGGACHCLGGPVHEWQVRSC